MTSDPAREMAVNYDALASGYDRRYRDNDYSGVETAVVEFAGAAAERVLEVGCGTGRWVGALIDRGVRANGVDASAEMLARARAALPRAAIVRATAERLPYAPGAFTHAFCVNAFHHFPDKQGFLREARRVLSPGGQLMIVGLDPHAGSDRWYIYDYFETAFDNDRRRYAAAARIREWLQDLGFDAVRTREVQHLPTTIPARASLETGRLARTISSQLALLTDVEYERGIERIRADIASAQDRGETLYLHADLRLYATCGSLPR